MRRRRRPERSTATSSARGTRSTNSTRPQPSPDRSSVAQVHRSTGNQAVQRQAEGGGGSDPYQQIENPENYDVTVSEADLEQAVVDALRRRGITPPAGSSMELADYVTVEANKRGGSYMHTVAHIPVAGDGTLIPTQEYMAANEPEGGYPRHSRIGARRMIQLRVSPWDEGHVQVFSRLISVETSGISKAADTRSATDVGSLSDGIGDVIEDANIEVGDAGTGLVPEEERDAGGDKGGTGDKDDEPGGGGGGDRGSPGVGPAVVGAGAGAAAAGRESGRPDRGRDRAGAPDRGNRPTPGGDYEVQEGDTLWDIADRTYGDPQAWPVIYESRENDIEDPDLIHPKQMLYLPPQREADRFDRSEYDAPESTGVGRGQF